LRLRRKTLSALGLCFLMKWNKKRNWKRYLGQASMMLEKRLIEKGMKLKAFINKLKEEALNETRFRSKKRRKSLKS